ncbi:uncharacterized protein EAE98_001629 [Botrytis deweyae]|uniref:DUF6536 domain-containing protein n=1 Tax=Botrytis deweyae TaxID=2478750 RepID=A0ABQ7IYD8_9HELO|nr:uncharacterized protein EAE98_001629 [Botrytis deweyae]KAF7937315.1 hypothetical protein EAE98_001629 [Botrytis deweyae]
MNYQAIAPESNTALVKNGDTCDKPTPLLSSTWRLLAVGWTLCTWVLATVAGCLPKNNNFGACRLKDVKASQNCDTIGYILNSLITGLNILAALLLMGSDYIRQRLLTPTRMDIDIAHSKNKWFIIGNQDFSNFRIVPIVARILWLSLLLTSLPIQLLLNGLFFVSDTSSDAFEVVVSPEWNTKPAYFDVSSVSIYQQIVDKNASSVAWATLAPLQKALEDLQVQRVNRSMVLESYALAGHDTTQKVSMFLSPPVGPGNWANLSIADCLLKTPFLTPCKSVLLRYSKANFVERILQKIVRTPDSYFGLGAHDENTETNQKTNDSLYTR